MRLEDHQHRGQVEILAEDRETLQQRLVSDVDPVEHADREHAAAMSRTQVVQAPDELQDGSRSVAADRGGARPPFAFARAAACRASGTPGRDPPEFGRRP